MISFVVPVYRAEDSLTELYRRIVAEFDKQGKSFEILFIEDCGGDGSWQKIQKLILVDSRVRGFKMSRNYGQHNSLLFGIREAVGDLIVTLDDDLQHPPEEISKLISKLDEGFDVVYGPPITEQHSFFRNIASKITKMAMAGTMGDFNPKNISALRVFRANLREAFVNYRNSAVNIDVLLTWATSRFSAVRVRHEARKFGESGYKTRMLITHAINMITGFSSRPLHLVGALGLLLAFLGGILLLYVIIKWVSIGSVVPGFTFLVSIVVIFSGAQLVALGILGEYLSRMHYRMMDRTQYFVSEQAVNLKTD